MISQPDTTPTRSERLSSPGLGAAAPPAAAEPDWPMPGLPPPDVKRWTIRRKAAVVNAVASGLLTREEALRRYQLSDEEFASWERAFNAHGLPGLRSTRLQQYRSPGSRRGGTED